MTRLSPTRILRAASCATLAILFASGVSAQPAGGPAARAFGESRPITDRYIVVFKNSVANPRAEADDAVRRVGGQRRHTFSRALKGFSATMSAEAAQRLRSDPAVDYVEQDQTISLSAVQSPATWGLDRIDQADRPMDGLYNYGYTGAGVNAFIIDTGIRADHAEFAGRMLSGFSAITDGNGTNDCNGHGTHVAGTVGGTTWGVAKGVSLIPVRVLDCAGSGSFSGVIAGIDWVANSALRPAVANMSLGGGFSQAVNDAVKNAVAHGVVMAVAAGNSNRDACNYSPASEPSAITVGATTNLDARASYSNFGTCVDIFAPGSGITSSWSTGASDTNTISGTSMATPHVTGVAALALQANPSASPLAVTDFLLDNATLNRLASLGSGSPNRLLYSVGAGAPTEPPLPTIAIGALSGRSGKAGAGWNARVTVTVRNVDTGRTVANVTVSGTFAPGGTASCVTSSRGQCTISSAPISNDIPSSTFTVNNAAANGMTYDGSQNSASQVIINRR
jgi:aqualysin 1